MDFKILDEAQGRYRAYVDVEGDQTVIKIFGGHSAIKRYLGPAPEFLYQGSKEARIVIAETIAGEAARMVMRRKFATSNDSDVEGFYAHHMFYLEKYLARCHKISFPRVPTRDLRLEQIGAPDFPLTLLASRRLNWSPNGR